MRNPVAKSRSRSVVMPRDRELFDLLGRARWLSTSQVQRRFFAGRSANAVNKRLRKLVRAGFLRCVRPGMADEQWFRLGPAAQIEADIPSRLPAHLEHFSGINDVRLWLENMRVRELLPVGEFLAEWELKTVGQGWPVVPDGVVFTNEQGVLIAFEMDCSTENPRMLASKLRRYGAAGRDIEAVVIVATSWPRLRSITKVLLEEDAAAAVRCLLTERTRLVQASAQAKVFVDVGALALGEGAELVSAEEFITCPVGISCREEGLDGVSACTEHTSRSHVLRDSATAEGGSR